MLIAFALEGGLHKSYGMDELSKRLLDHEPISFKTVAGTGKAQKSFKHVELAAGDLLRRRGRRRHPAHLRAPAAAPVARERLLTVYETLERPMPKVLVEMELAGVKVDPERLRQLSNDFAVRMGELEAEAHRVAGRPFNLGSPKQIGDMLFSEMGLAVRHAPPPPAPCPPTPRCWRTWPPRATSCRASSWTGASSRS